MPSPPMGSFHRLLATMASRGQTELPPEWAAYLQYVAGMFEVGGYCYCAPAARSYTTYLSIRSLTGDRAAKLIDTLGGTMGAAGVWRLGARGGVTVATHLLPYLHERRAEVTIWLKARQLMDRVWLDRDAWTPAHRSAMEGYVAELRAERAHQRDVAEALYLDSRRMPETSPSTSASEEQETQVPPAS